MNKKRFFSLVMTLVLLLTLLPVQTASAATSSAKPATVKKLKAGVCTTRSINLSWAKVNDASGYQVYRAYARNGKYSLLKNVKSTAFMNTTVTAGTEYFYRVRAFKYTSSGTVFGKFSGILRANTKPLSFRRAITKFSVNVRKSAGVNYSRLFGLAKGTAVTILCQTQDKTGCKWYRIQTNVNGKKRVGYIRSDLLR